MLRTLKDLFDTFTTPAGESSQERDASLKLATAVLLVDVLRADKSDSPAERDMLLKILHEKFALANGEVNRLMELAESTAKNASDYFQFTSRINDSIAHPQKIQLVENLWQIAYADGHLDANENSLIGKIAELLHVTQGEYIGAKMRAKEAASLAYRATDNAFHPVLNP